MNQPAKSLFDNQPEFLTPEGAAGLVHSSRATVYDWNYRPKKYQIPAGMFTKFGRKLFIRTDVFKQWVTSRNETGVK